MNKGFTLIETILVLTFLSVFVVVFSTSSKVKSNLFFACEKIKDILIHEKANAILYKEKRIVFIGTNYVQLKEKRMEIENKVYCDTYEVVFNPRGNVQEGGSVVCYYKGIKRKIIINLGSGNIYVK